MGTEHVRSLSKNVIMGTEYVRSQRKNVIMKLMFFIQPPEYVSVRNTVLRVLSENKIFRFQNGLYKNGKELLVNYAT